MKQNIIIRLNPAFSENKEYTKIINKHIVLPFSTKHPMRIFEEESMPQKESNPEQFNKILENCEILISDDSSVIEEGEVFNIPTVFHLSSTKKEHLTSFEEAIVEISKSTQTKRTLEENPELKESMQPPKEKDATKICLCMIVKNESAVIERCLQSVKKLIDEAVIVDTGSSDNTVEIINNFFRKENIPGEVMHEQWRDFAYNRNVGLISARKRESGYILHVDADEIIEYEKGFNVQKFKKSLSKFDVHDMSLRVGGTFYRRAAVFSNSKDFIFKGVVHEVLVSESDQDFTKGYIAQFYNTPTPEGARAKDPQKWEKDIEALEKALETETDEFWRRRYMFYLAQSYRDARKPAQAIYRYQERATMGGWNQEIFESLNSSALMKANLGYPKYEVIQEFLRAYEAAPDRAESLLHASFFCRVNGWWNQAYIYSKQALSLVAGPRDGLFVISWVYDFGIYEEHALTSNYTGRHREAIKYCNLILKENKIDDGVRERVLGYKKLAEDHLPKK